MLLVDLHDLLVHLGAPRIRFFEALVSLLDFLNLRLHRLHLFHRDHLLQTKRKQQQGQQQGKQHDGPTVIVHKSVNPLQREQKRSDKKGKKSEVDYFSEICSFDAFEYLLILRSEEELKL